MMVCAHGDVVAFCKERNLDICETWDGNIEDYSGRCPVLVTDQDMCEEEYYYWKGRLWAKGVNLISTRHKDDPKLVAYLSYEAEQRKQTYGGRQPFGYTRKNGVVTEIPEMMAVVRRILELRDAGYTLRRIREDAGVYHPDGRKISVSTIQQIIVNREKYENG